MISGRRLPILVLGLALLTPSGVLAKRDLVFSESVITAETFQRIFWREFLIEFPNIYAKANHRIFKAGTVIFYDSDQIPTLLLFANQEIRQREDGLASRVTRLNMRSPSGKTFLGIMVSDVGEDLGKTPLEQLLIGKLPLDLYESKLRGKNIVISGKWGADVRLEFQIRSAKAGESAAILRVVTENRSLFRIEEIRKDDSRDVTWFLDDRKVFEGSRTLRARRTRTDWMLFGSEEYYMNGLEITPGAFQIAFSESDVQSLIVGFPEQMQEAIESAFCREDCDEDKPSVEDWSND